MKYISFIDILGFKDLIENNTLDSVLGIYRTSLETSYDLVFEELASSPELKSSDSAINSKIISDSIILWTNEANSNSFIKLITVTSALFYTLYRFGIPVRGGINVGDLEEITIKSKTEFETKVLIGKALTQVYKLETQQQWSGAIVSDKAIQHFEELVRNGKSIITLENLLTDSKTLAKYNAPLKSGEIREFYVLNWPYYFQSRPTAENVRSIFALHNKKTDTWEVELKIKNTIDFINSCYDII